MIPSYVLNGINTCVSYLHPSVYGRLTGKAAHRCLSAWVEQTCRSAQDLFFILYHINVYSIKITAFCWSKLVLADVSSHFDVYCFPRCTYLLSKISCQWRSPEVSASADGCLSVKWASVLFQLPRMLLINLETWTERWLLKNRRN